MEKTNLWNSLTPKDKANFILKIIKYILISIFLGWGSYKGYDYFKEYGIDIKNKSSSTSTSTIQNQIHFGQNNAIISRQFSDASQACWYYHSDYKHLHPYTLLWNVNEGDLNEFKFPKIRVIAEANWYAQNCVYDKPNLQVKLLGIEYTKHRIEAQLSEDSDFVHIANSNAYYGSELIFDSVGRIKERRILKSKDDFKCEISGLSEKIKRENWIKREDCEQKEEGEKEEMKNKIKKLRERADLHFNHLEIDFFIEKEDKLVAKEYTDAINIYIKKREGLHGRLASDGCGVITIEPVLENESYNAVKPAIAFLCFKDGAKSHVRMMIRK